ncbi:MAG: FAD-dependent monooxygenase [Bacteroidetes bacterium]|nr:MAG: FAD-dependent monooxygenase [Bacteroidota bacterium]
MKKTIISGAGLVGSLWAILLAKRGYEVEVYERRSDMRRAGFVGGRSINLAMSDRGWKAMEKAGIFDQIRSVAIPMHGRMIHDLKGELTFQPYGKEGQAIYSVSRGGLNLELLKIADSFEQVRLFFDQKTLGVNLEKNALRIEHTQTGARTEVSGDVIFGADGAFSAVRGTLQKTPRFNYSQTYLEHGYKELTIPPGENGTHLLEKNALHIWPRGHFMLIALPNHDGSFTCTLFLPFEGDISFEKLKTDADVRAFFEKWFPDALPLMPDLATDFRENPTGTLVTVRCHPWQYDNRVLLIGDAAHAIVPFYGQGMNAGFEDCTILDEMMDEYGDDWSRIIAGFNAVRPRDANAIADLAIRNFTEMRDKVADPRFLLRKKIEQFLHKNRPNDFLPVYSMVTFSHIPYHKALEESARQDALFDRILAIENIEEKYDGPEVLALFEAWKNNKL